MFNILKFTLVKLDPSITFEPIGLESSVIALFYISVTRGIHL